MGLTIGVGRTAEHGEILFPRFWYEGFCRALESIKVQLADAPPHHLLNDPDEIVVFFDKSASHSRFLNAGLPVPRRADSFESLSQLAEAMGRMRIRQAFVKLAHGSSASGAVAVRTDGNGRWRAYTTVEQSGDRLYNSRRIRTLEDPEVIDSLIRALAPHGLHTEEWLPKAALDGYGFDLRALVIRGKLRHVVARMSHTPMTNLHLLNRRADAETVRLAVGDMAWNALNETSERAAEVFPNSLHIGLDVMWLPGFKRLCILEANAFGDLLPGTLWNNQTTYETELEAMGC
ncbi:MAG: STM4014 family protein [Fibrella sp.]|nr:STM4014 family protein [Armatimonadota bacterium]